MSGGYGFATQLGIGTADPVDTRLDFENCSIGMSESILDTNGLRGTRERDISRVAAGVRICQGDIVLRPTAVELAAVLPWILGGTPSGTDYPLADTLSSRYVTIDRDVEAHTYDSVYVDRAVFEASEGESLMLTIGVNGSDEADDTFPSLSIDTTTPQFYFWNLVLSVGGTNYSAKNFQLTIDNALDTERIFNSQTRNTTTCPKDRVISFSTMLPYSLASAVYDTGSGGVAVIATFTNGAVSLTFTMNDVAFGQETPRINGREEIMVPVTGNAFADAAGGTASLITTLDSTP